MKLTKEVVVKKLDSALDKRIKEVNKMNYLTKDQKNEKLKNLNIRNITSLNYMVRSNYFQNYKNSCGLNPETMDGHSYQWYSLVKRIKGIVILNTYVYSVQTSKHISKMRNVLSNLDIRYQQLDAPKGLQSLDVALNHNVELLAKSIVYNKYCRNPKKNYNPTTSSDLKLLAKLGYKHTKKQLKQAIKDEESYRRSRLDRAKAQRKLEKDMKALEIIVDVENKKVNETGYHVVYNRNWQWNGDNVCEIEPYDRRNAVNKGFTKIIVHKRQITEKDIQNLNFSAKVDRLIDNGVGV